MIDLTKSHEFFDPDKVTGMVNIVGCGSVGSTIAENLARCGVRQFTLYDFDKVESHNIVNQMFKASDVGRLKVEALADIIQEINPDAKIVMKPDGWQGEILSGYVFLCVDSMEIRRKLFDKHVNSTYVKAMFDVRTMLTGAQTYAASWRNVKSKQDMRASMEFSDEEAAEETPVSACGVTLGIVTTVRIISAMCVNNFIKFVKGEKLWKFLQFDGFTGFMDPYEE